MSSVAEEVTPTLLKNGVTNQYCPPLSGRLAGLKWGFGGSAIMMKTALSYPIRATTATCNYKFQQRSQHLAYYSTTAGQYNL